MNRKTVIAGAIFAGLILVAIGLLRSPEKGTPPAGERPRPIPKLTVTDVDTLEITKGGATTVLKKQGDNYQVVKPVENPADKDGAKTAFEAVAKLAFGNIVSDQKARHNELEVGDGATRVVMKKGDKPVANLLLGKANGDQLLVRVDGKDEVWSASGVYKYQWEKDATAWRDKHITTFEEKDANRIEAVSKSRGRIVLERPAPTDAGTPPEWRIVEASEKVEPFDKSAASDVSNGLASFMADDFADSAKPAETGLDAPENTVTISLRDGKKFTVLIGKKKQGTENTYVKLADKPQVYLVAKYSASRVNKRPIDFRDKTMCNLTSGEITEVAVTRDKDSFVLSKTPGKTGDDAWKLSKPAGLTLDTSKVSNILSAFSDWKANNYADDNSPKAAGLVKPSTVISAKSNVKGHACTLKVGSEASDKTYLYAAPNGQADVVMVPKWSVERIAVKLDDLKKK